MEPIYPGKSCTTRDEGRKILVFRDMIKKGDDFTIDEGDYNVVVKMLESIKNQTPNEWVLRNATTDPMGAMTLATTEGEMDYRVRNLMLPPDLPKFPDAVGLCHLSWTDKNKASILIGLLKEWRCHRLLGRSGHLKGHSSGRYRSERLLKLLYMNEEP